MKVVAQLNHIAAQVELKKKNKKRMKRENEEELFECG